MTFGVRSGQPWVRTATPQAQQPRFRVSYAPSGLTSGFCQPKVSLRFTLGYDPVRRFALKDRQECRSLPNRPRPDVLCHGTSGNNPAMEIPAPVWGLDRALWAATLFGSGASYCCSPRF